MKTLVRSLSMLTASMPAFCQSSVTIFGTLDLNVTHARAGGASETFMDQGGNRVPSRLGFRGTEDLGDGLAASFWLESALLPDSGGVAGAFFSRRSTVSLSFKDWGELRVGRDYVPTMWNLSAFTPFGTVGVAGSSNIIHGWPTGFGTAKTAIRASNSVGYLLAPTASGFYGQAMHAFGEGIDGARYTGARLGWTSGPADAAIAYGVTPTQGGDYKTWTLGGTYAFSAVKLFGNHYRHGRPGDTQANTTLGVSFLAGQGQLLASIARSDRKGAGVAQDDATQAGVGYVYSLSKRTDLYGTYSRIRNDGNAGFVTAGLPAGAAGRPSSGLQVGLTHRF